jgi:AcrR family transcriptional regulator
MSRITSEATKKRLTAATLEVVGKEGVEGATTARIAEAAGLSPAALYKHFATRNDLLLAAIDSLYDTIYEVVIESSSEPNVLERLRSIGRLHSDLIVSGRGSFIYPFIEFLASPPESGLREAQGVRQLQMIQAVAAIVEEGKAQGSIAMDVDSEQVAWQLHAVWWAEDISHLMGLDQFVTAGRSSTILNNVLGRLPNRSQLPEQDDDMARLRRLLGLCPLVNPPAE